MAVSQRSGNSCQRRARRRALSIHALLVSLLLPGLVLAATWDGGGGDNNFDTDANWDPDGDRTSGSSEWLVFPASSRYSPNNNYGDNTDWQRIVFQSGASSYTLGGNIIDLFWKVENEDDSLQTISLGLRAQGSGLEINPLNGAITVSGNVDNNGLALNVYGDSGHKLTLSGVVSGSGGLMVQQNSNVEITGSSTFSGNVEIDEGEFWLGAGGAIGNGNIYVGNGGQQTDTAKLWISDGDGGATLSNTIYVNDSDADKRYIGGLNSSGVNTFSGAINLDDDVIFETVNDGDLEYSGAIDMSDNGTDDDIKIVGDGDVEISGAISATTGGSEVLHTGAGELYLSGDNATSVNNQMKLTISGGGTLRLASVDGAGDAPTGAYTDKINFGGSGGTLYVTSDVTFDSNVGMTIADGVRAHFKVGDGSGDDLEINGVISDANDNGVVIQNGPGTLRLAGANTYGGATLISNGTVRIIADSGLGTAPGSPTAGRLKLDGGTLYAYNVDVTVNANRGIELGPSGGTLQVTSGEDLIYGGIIAGSGDLTKDGGGDLDLRTGSSTFTGSTTIKTGAILIDDDDCLGAAPGLPTAGHLVFEGATLYAHNANVTLNANRGISLGIGGGTLQVTSGETLTYGGIIAGANGLAKEGAGQVTLNGTNSYSGTTDVNGGEMVVNGSATNSDFAVDSGTVLGGTGTVGTVMLSGQLVPGTDVLNDIGTLAVTGLTIQGNSSYRWEAGDASGSTDRDVVTVGDAGGETVTISASSGSECTIYLDDSEISNWNAGSSKNWTIIDAGTLTGYDATDFAIDDSTYWSTSLAGGSFSISNESGNLVLYFTAAEADPGIAVSETSLAYTGALGTELPSQTFNATNIGGGTLTYTNSMAYGSGWGSMTVTVAPGTGTAAATSHQIQTVTVSRAASIGTFYATNTLAGNQTNGSKEVEVVLTVTNLPNATDLSVTDKGTRDLSVNWTRPGTYNVMVVRRQGANPDPPTDGTSYAHDSTYGPGNRNQVIYAAGAGSSDPDSALQPQTAYHYGFFTENFSYYSPGSFLATTTLTSEVDGNKEDWVGNLPAVVNASAISSNEFLWRDKESEERTDSGQSSNVDIEEFRMRADADDAYFMMQYRDITDTDYPYVAIGIDTDRNPSDGAMAWIADDSDTGLGDGYYTNSSPGMHYPERNIIVHLVPNIGHRIELHADDGSSWYSPPTHGDTTTFFGSGADGIVEFKIARGDLGLSGVVTARLTVASYFNNDSIGNDNYANDGDTTADYTGTDAQDTLSVLPYGVNDAAGNYGTAGEETGDNDLDTFFDVTFDADGLAVNVPPVAPDLSNTNFTLPTNNATIEQGRLSLHWPAGTAADTLTSYFVELSTNSTFGGGENVAVTHRANTKHTEEFCDLLAALPADTYYWRVRSRDLSGMLSGHSTNQFTVSGTDDDTAGPTPSIVYIGPNYTGSESQTSITDADLVNTNEQLDIVVEWTDPSGVFLTNSVPYPNTNVLDTLGRVIANWDVTVSNSVDGAQQLGYDKVFNRFLGETGDGTVTTIFYNAFALTTVSLDDSFFLTLSAEDNDNDRGTRPDPQGNGDPIPHDRMITTNRNVQFTVTDNDTVGPVVSALVIAGDAAGPGSVWGSELISGSWSLTGRVTDATTGINVNTGVVTGVDIAPYVQLIDPSGTVRLTNAFDDLSVDDGDGQGTVVELSHQTPSGLSAAHVVSGVWTVRVVTADNDEHRDGDRSFSTNHITFGVPTFEWDAGGGADKDWSTAANWTHDAEPCPIHTAHINGGSTADVSVAGESVTALYIGDNGVSQNGSPATGIVQVIGGALTVATDLVLGENSGDRGDLQAGSGSVAVTNDLVVGQAGSGYVTASGSGSIAVTHDVEVGAAAGGYGSVVVSGGSLSCTNNFLVGASGSTGALGVASGQLTTGGALDDEDLVIGSGGEGGMTVSGGTVQMRDDRDLEVALGAGSDGNVTISGAGQVLTSAGGDLTVGDGAGAEGTIEVQGGLLGIDGTVEIGAQGGGTLNVSGGSVTNASAFYVGAGANGTGTVDQTGGSVKLYTSSGSLWIGARTGEAGTRGYYSISGGSLETEGNLRVGLDDTSGTGVLHVVGAESTITVGDGTTEDFEMRQNADLRFSFTSNAITTIETTDDIILDGALTISNSVALTAAEYVIITSSAGSVSGTFAATNWNGSVSGYVLYRSDHVAIAFTPEIAVRGTNTSLVIPSGDVTPAVADGTDFGPVVWQRNKTHTYAVANTDPSYTLGLTGTPTVAISGPHITSFALTDFPAATLAPGATDSIGLEYTPQSVGMHTITVSIANTDITGDEAPYTFHVTGEGTYHTEPTQHAGNMVFSAITNVSMTVGWDAGNGTGRVVVARAGSAVTTPPADGTDYAEDATLGDGQITAAGDHVVYDGTGTNVTVNGLSPGVTYHFTVFEYNGNSLGINYLTNATPLSGSQAAATYPPVITGGTSTNVVMSENGDPTAFSLTLDATDPDPGDTPLTWSIQSAAFHGAADVSGTGASRPVSYSPPDYYAGTDSFVVKVTDSFGNTDTITVNVTITAVNKAGKTLFIFE